MNWNAVGVVGEIIGALAVVVSLIYLAKQIRQSTQVARSSMRHSITDAAMTGGRCLAENDDLAELMQRHIDGEHLKPHQYLRLQAFAYMTTRNWENIHFQYLSGMLTQHEWQAFRKNLKTLYQARMWKDYWGREQELYTDAFRDEIDRILGEIGSGGRVAEGSVLFAKNAGDQDVGST